MGRHAEGWKLTWRNGLAYVRFSTRDPVTGKTVRPEIPTGEREPRQAANAASKIYAEAIAGRIPVTRTARTNVSPLVDLVNGWLGDLAKTYPANTVKCYREYSCKWMARWKTLGDITPVAVADFTRDGLGRAMTKTIRKELSALLGNFFVWCVEKEHIAETSIPPRPVALLRKSTGKRTGPQRQHRVEVTPKQIAAFIKAVPEFGGSRTPGVSWRAQDAVIVMYETGLRPSTVGKLSCPENWSPGDKVLRVGEAIDKAKFGREVPLSAKAIAALTRSAGKGPIFGLHGYRTLFANAIAVSGTPSGFSIYDVRHARGQHLVDAGASLPGVAYLLGHKRLTTTNTYVRAAQGEAAKALLFGEILVKPVLVKKSRSKKVNDNGAKEGT